MVIAALAAAVAAVLVAGVSTALFWRPAGSARGPSCAGGGCSSATTKRAVPAPPGPTLRYRTVDREVGYFEATVTIVNRGSRPMPSWTLSFSYPGAEIRNAWEVVLQQKGRNVVITSKPTAVPIAPGGSFEVRFGGGGTPSMPTGCRLNSRPCTFTR